MSVWKTAVFCSGAMFLTGWGTAQAQTCSDNAGCPKGFTCEVIGGSACAAPDIACAPGEKCPAPPPCQVSVYRECQPGACKVDSDCAEGMVCYEQKTEVCTGSAVPPCAPGSKCPEVAPPVCNQQSSSTCTPRYLLPCTDDNSCGVGFACKDEQTCSCAGSSGSATPSAGGGSAPSGSGSAPSAGPALPAIDGGQAPPPSDKPAATDAGAPSNPGNSPTPPDTAPSCQCQPSGQKSCELKELSCKQDSDCPAQFKCQADATNSTTTNCAVPPPGLNVDASACSAPTPASPVLHCIPPYYGVTRAADFSNSEGSAPQASGTVGGQPTSAASKPPSASHDADAGTASADKHAKACSVGSPGARAAKLNATWLGALALGLLWLRRRRG